MFRKRFHIGVNEMNNVPSLISVVVRVGLKLIRAASARAVHVLFHVTPITTASASTAAARAPMDPTIHALRGTK